MPARKKAPNRAHATVLLIEEFKTRSGITDPEAHRHDHETFRNLRPLFEDFHALVKDLKDDVIPYVRQQRQLIIDKNTDNREVYKTIKVWAIKLVITLIALSVFYGGVHTAVAHLLPHLGGD